MGYRKKQPCRLWAVLKTVGGIFLPSLTQSVTLEEQLKVAVESFSSGNHADAYWHFESIELDYGDEPEFLNRNFQRTVLPVRAYAALMADRPTDAIIHFGDLLKHYKPRPSLRAFALYNAAIAQSQTGATAKAAWTFEAFRLSFPDSDEAGLALLQQADLLAEIGEISESETLLDAFYQSEASPNLRMQGRLRAIQLASDANDTVRIRKLLFETDWQVADMPDIAILSFAATEAGDLLLQEGLPEVALKAYRLTLPRDYLIEKQRESLSTAKRILESRTIFASSIWKSHWQRLVARLDNQLRHLETMPDYTPGLQLRKGQAYLLAKRYREAAILFRTIALKKAFETELRAEAHYRWILSLSEAGKWEEARTIARDFLLEYPDHELAQSTSFLIARAFQSEGRYVEAIRVLDDLIAGFPDHKMAPRWYFTRGYNYCALENQPQARDDFETALENYPDSPLAKHTELWKALTFFFERNYADALEGLRALEAKSEAHPLYPEIVYRIANVHYARRDYRTALQAGNALIEKHPDHHRIPEIRALRGDIYMGIGELDLAVKAFDQVGDENFRIYDYAVFQAAKVYKALEHYEQQRRHLQAYVDRDDAHERPRTSEALYWIGWTLQRQDRHEDAYPVFEEALKRFGDDPEARGVNSILTAYGNLYKHDRNAGFDRWLQEESERSLKEDRLTWFSRLTLQIANRQRRSIDETTAEATLLSIHRIVPIKRQDVAAIKAVGLALAKRSYQSADDYFEHILNHSSDLRTKASAYYGKAKLALEKNQLNDAQHWLVRFLEKTPIHPLGADARLLTAEIFNKQGRHEEAVTSLNNILKIKEMRGRPHARALSALARTEMRAERPKRAIAYWQRVYTLYRAYPDLIAPAYWESALLFERLGDLIAARNTLQEMLRDRRLQFYKNHTLAKAKLERLNASLAEPTTDPESKTRG